MKTESGPLEFLATSQKDPKLAASILAAIEKGGMVTAREVMQVAKEAGYSFTREEFESAVHESIRKRFAAGQQGLAALVNADDPPESSCAKGCLSYTQSWCPDPGLIARATDPVRE